MEMVVLLTVLETVGTSCSPFQRLCPTGYRKNPLYHHWLLNSNTSYRESWKIHTSTWRLFFVTCKFTQTVGEGGVQVAKTSMFIFTISYLTTCNLPWFMNLTFQVFMQDYSAASDFTFITRHIHNWASFLFILSEAISRRRWQPTPVLLPGKSHGRRSLVGCSPWRR